IARFGTPLVVDGEALDDAIDAPLTRHSDDVEPELPEHVGPLARLNRHAVPPAEAEGDEDGGRSGQRPASAGACSRRLVASSTARARASGSLPPRTIADPDTISSWGGTTNTRVATATSRLPRFTHAAVSTSALSAAGTKWRRASRVAWATARLREDSAMDPSANPTLSSSPRLSVTRAWLRIPRCSDEMAPIETRDWPTGATIGSRCPRSSWTTEMIRWSNSMPKVAIATDCTSRAICLGLFSALARMWSSLGRPISSVTI